MIVSHEVVGLKFSSILYTDVKALEDRFLCYDDFHLHWSDCLGVCRYVYLILINFPNCFCERNSTRREAYFSEVSSTCKKDRLI